jgi:hypothetical protein
MNYSEHLVRQHVRQTLRLGGALLLVVLIATVVKWPDGGLESIRASVHARPPTLADCGRGMDAGLASQACPSAQALAAR